MRHFSADWDFIDRVEAEIQKQLKRHLYDPIKEIFEDNDILSNAIKQNALSTEEKWRQKEREFLPIERGRGTEADLKAALRSGRIQYWANKFTGRFDAKTSRDLRNLGAQWRDSMGGYFYLPLEKLPDHLTKVIDEVHRKFIGRMEDADKKLSKITGLKVASTILAIGLIYKALEKSEKDFQLTMDETNKEAGDKVSRRELAEAAPKKKTMKEIADVWEENMQRTIAKWTDDEVKQLRQNLKGLIFQAKNYGRKTAPKDLNKYVFEKYGARIAEIIYPGKQLSDLNKHELVRIENRAKFIAQGEFAWAMTTYKYTRAQDSGADYFRWVTRSDDRVRKSHKALAGKIYRFDTPPLDTQLNRHLLPQQPYNCRCEAEPIKLSQLKKGKDGKPLQKKDGSYMLA